MRAHHLLSVVLCGATAISALAGCADGDENSAVPGPTALSSEATTAAVAATELVTGDCISGLVIGAAERRRIDSVRIVDCASAHDIEVFATFELSPRDFEVTEDGAYPGEQRVVRAADQGCAERLEELGLEAEYGLIALWPTGRSWAQGDRGVKCAAFPRDGEPFDGPGLLARADPGREES